jgi:ABC-type bacteriocin/lantibiotic exporter with double-glycine peptidase domain
MTARSVSRFTASLFILLAISYCTGCISTPKQAAVLQVPFHPQPATNHCGITALAMALDFFHIPYSTNTLYSKAFIPALEGSTLQSLSKTAQDYGLAVTASFSDVSDFHHSIENGALPLVYLAPTDENNIGHFVIVTGVSDNLRFIRIHDTQAPNRWIRYSRLARDTKNGTYPTLYLAAPRPHTRE